jgi:hypothetical protein
MDDALLDAGSTDGEAAAAAEEEEDGGHGSGGGEVARELAAVDNLFGAIAAGDVAVYGQAPLGGGDAAPAARRPRRWGELAGAAGSGDAAAEAALGARGVASAERQRQVLVASHLGIVPGWRVYALRGRKRGALSELGDAETEACELCRWEATDGEGVMARLSAQYEAYAQREQGRSGMWARLAQTYNTEVVSALASFGGALPEAYARAVGLRPRAVTAAECKTHFTGHCGNDIVRPHQERRLHSLQFLFDRLDDELLMVPDGTPDAQAGAHARVDRDTAKMMLSTAVAIERTERLLESHRRRAVPGARAGGGAARAPRGGGGAKAEQGGDGGGGGGTGAVAAYYDP